MGKLEKRAQDRMRRTKINKAIIGAISVAGVLAVGALAPGVMGALGKMKLIPQERYRVKTTLGRMIQKEYVQMEKRGGKQYIKLTPKGERFARMMQEGTIIPGAPSRWDGKWRIVTYDFHGQATVLRRRVRELLLAWGFSMLHQSVWIYPYDCEDLIFILKQEFKLGKGLLYIIAEEVENDLALRLHFKLHKDT